MKKYALKRASGKVSILTLINEEKDINVEIAKLNELYNIVSYREIAVVDLPANRKFRDAWTDDNPTTTVDVDLTKAQEVVRKKRDALLLKLDDMAYAESRKPVGNVAAVNTEAQRLRDIPQDVRFSSGSLADLEALYDDTDIQLVL